MSIQAGSGPARALLPAIVLCAMLPASSGAADAPYKEREGKDVVDAVCSACHAPGKDNAAPKIGDRPAWIPRLKNGLDRLVASAVHGHGAMPARGGLAELSDQEIRGAVVYMFNQGLPASAAPAPAAAVPVDPRHKVVSGTDVYFGMMRAESVPTTVAPKADIPSGKGYYHLSISLADNKSQQPVTDAHVTVRVSDGMTTQSKELALVAANNSVSYGNYFRFSSGTAYNITAEIRRPGVPGVIEAKFDVRGQ